MLAMVLLLFVTIWYVDYTVLKPQVGVMLPSLLGPPDPTKTQLIEDPETGERKAKMTEVQCYIVSSKRIIHTFICKGASSTGT